MRIIAGEFRSRQLKTLDNDLTRPTTDKVREAVFSHLGTYFEGGTMLDLFAGSGAVALEALSRGFEKAWLIDNSRPAAGIIKENIRNLKLEERTTVMTCSYRQALSQLEREGRQFDLIYLDPPYRYRLGSELIRLLAESGLVKPDGVVVLETAREETAESFGELVREKEAVYGICRITYFRREKQNADSDLPGIL